MDEIHHQPCKKIVLLEIYQIKNLQQSEEQ